MIATDMLILAAENPLTSSALFGTVQSFFRVVGGIVVIAGIWTVAKSAIAGQIPQAIKKAIGAFLVAALLFNITIPINLASGLGGLVSRVGELIQGVVDGEETTVGGTSGTPAARGETGGLGGNGVR